MFQFRIFSMIGFCSDVAGDHEGEIETRRWMWLGRMRSREVVLAGGRGVRMRLRWGEGWR